MTTTPSTTTARTIYRHAALALLALIALAAGCGEDGVSVPQPVPVPKSSLLRFSSPRTPQTRLLIIGLPGAVDGAGQVEATDVPSGKRALAPSSGEGSFGLLVDASSISDVELRFINGDGRSEPAPIVQAGRFGGPLLGEPTSNGAIQRPNGQGEVVVSNDGGAGQPLLFSATPDSIAHLSNPANGALTSGVTDSIGRLTLSIAASSGDILQLVLADPQEPTETSNYLSLPVP